MQCENELTHPRVIRLSLAVTYQGVQDSEMKAPPSFMTRIAVMSEEKFSRAGETQ